MEGYFPYSARNRFSLDSILEEPVIYGLSSSHLQRSRNGNSDGHCPRLLPLCHERYVHHPGLASTGYRPTARRHSYVRIPFRQLIRYSFDTSLIGFYFPSPFFFMALCFNSCCTISFPGGSLHVTRHLAVLFLAFSFTFAPAAARPPIPSSAPQSTTTHHRSHRASHNASRHCSHRTGKSRHAKRHRTTHAAQP